MRRAPVALLSVSLIGFSVCLQAALQDPGRVPPPTEFSSISGHIRRSPGTEDAPIELTSIRVDTQHGDSYDYFLWDINANGSFLIPKLAPGVYGLKVEARSGGRGRRLLAAAVRIVDLGRTPVRDIELKLQPFATASGVVDVNGPVMPDPEDVRVIMRPDGPAPYLRDFRGGDLSEPSLREPFAFQFDRLVGAQRLVVDTPDGLILESAVLDDRTDITDRPYVFESGKHYSKIRVTLTSRCATVKATVPVGVTGDPRGGIVVTVFPEDRTKRYSSSRFVRSAVVAEDRTFEITNLPPGETYFVAAHRWGLPTNEKELAALENTATSVFIDRPGTFRVTVKLIQ